MSQKQVSLTVEECRLIRVALAGYAKKEVEAHAESIANEIYDIEKDNITIKKEEFVDAFKKSAVANRNFQEKMNNRYIDTAIDIVNKIK